MQLRTKRIVFAASVAAYFTSLWLTGSLGTEWTAPALGVVLAFLTGATVAYVATRPTRPTTLFETTPSLPVEGTGEAIPSTFFVDLDRKPDAEAMPQAGDQLVIQREGGEVIASEVPPDGTEPARHGDSLHPFCDNPELAGGLTVHHVADPHADCAMFEHPHCVQGDALACPTLNREPRVIYANPKGAPLPKSASELVKPSNEG